MVAAGGPARASLRPSPPTHTQPALTRLNPPTPTAAEELCYRGFLLSALRSRLGAVDAAAVAAALFAAAHLSIPQVGGGGALGESTVCLSCQCFAQDVRC
jgi:hypothetical protein